MRTWNEKPYHSLDYMLRERFQEKVYKVTLNAGMTCPNRDGTLGRRGCIFCSEGGSGDFAADARLSITGQIDSQIKALQSKRPIRKYIAYFQAYTNTYAPVPYLEKVFTEAISHPGIVGLSIGTRPDCLGADVLELLNVLNQRKPVWVELGLQTMHGIYPPGLSPFLLPGSGPPSPGCGYRGDRTYDPGPSRRNQGRYPENHGLSEYL